MSGTQNSSSYFEDHKDLFETDDKLAATGIWAFLINFLVTLKLDQLSYKTSDYLTNYVCSAVDSQIKKMKPDSDEPISQKDQEIAMQEFILEQAQDQCEYVMTSILFTFNPLSQVQDFSVPDLEGIVLTSRGESSIFQMLSLIAGRIPGLLFAYVKGLFHMN